MTELIAVITITMLAVISPGPDFAMVTRNSLVLSRRSGIWTAIGIGLGVMIHVTYTLLGVSILIQQSNWLYNAIKLVGALYLIYLGLKMLLSKNKNVLPNEKSTPISNWAALRAGFLTNALNPKTTLFIVSLFLQIVQSDTHLVIQIGYGLFISLEHISWFILVAVCFSASLVRDQILRVHHWLDRTFGCLLIIFGGILAMSHN